MTRFALVLKFARRYLAARKSHNAINIISWISVAGVTVGTMGLVIVLSVFNGFGNLVLELYNAFDPDILITPATGKTFDPASIDIREIKKLPGVKYVNMALEENALLRYRERQYIVTVKGVDEHFTDASDMKEKIIDGTLNLYGTETDYALVGGQIAYAIGLVVDDPFHPLTLFVPDKQAEHVNFMNPGDAVIEKSIYASGVFSIQQDFDSKYILVPLRFARQLTGEPRGVTSMEICTGSTDEDALISRVKAICGPGFIVKSRLEQHAFLYKILKSEKTAVYLILSFILLIATFNILGSLTMLVIEKKHDISILSAMGADEKLIRNIFLAEGMMISMGGAFTGMLLGFIICFIQMRFGIIRLENADSFVIDAYPVAMQGVDFLRIFAIVFTIGLISAWYTSVVLVKKRYSQTIAS